jgi:MOSC domain-containing protein YiiM
MRGHRTKEELQAGLDYILGSPQDDGTLECIVIRPDHGVRESLESCELSLEKGAHGDHWAKGCWKSTEDGNPHPDVQICIMNARCIEVIAGEKENWPPAGDNLFLDLDLRPDNMPPGTRLAIGSAVLEITAIPHNGCASFVESYGKPAAVFVNGPRGKALRLRGLYARVVEDGRVALGDKVTKVSLRMV